MNNKKFLPKGSETIKYHHEFLGRLTLLITAVFLALITTGCAPNAKDMNLASADIKESSWGKWNMEGEVVENELIPFSGSCRLQENFSLRGFSTKREILVSTTVVLPNVDNAYRCFDGENVELKKLGYQLLTDGVIGDEFVILLLSRERFQSYLISHVNTKTLKQASLFDFQNARGILHLGFRKGKVVASLFFLSNTDLVTPNNIEVEKKWLIEVAQNLSKKIP